MLEDARYHRFHASQDLLAIEGTGLAELVKKQRDHLAQLKTAFENADNQITPGNRNVTDEEADFARVVNSSKTDINYCQSNYADKLRCVQEEIPDGQFRENKMKIVNHNNFVIINCLIY